VEWPGEFTPKGVSDQESFEDIPGHLRRWIEGPDQEFHEVSYVDGLSERVGRPASNVHSRKRSLSMSPTISAEASGQFTVGDDVTVNRFAMRITGEAFGAIRKMWPRSLQLSPIFGLGIKFHRYGGSKEDIPTPMVSRLSL
jgi:hypothetical protein